nr:hypothetical protein GCM10020093_085030 [Planobispora longispora]
MGLRIEQSTGMTNAHRRPPAENDRHATPPEAPPGDPVPADR